MPAVKTPAESDKLPGSPHDSAPEAARERREAERLITDWKQETTQLGQPEGRLSNAEARRSGLNLPLVLNCVEVRYFV